MLTDPLATAHDAPDPGLPPVTYHVMAQGDVGAMMPLPCPVTRSGAFDAARSAIAAGRRVRVEMIQRNPQTGAALAISDATGVMLTDSDRRAEAVALADDLRQIQLIDRLHFVERLCNMAAARHAGLQAGEVIDRWHGRRGIAAKLRRLLRIGGAA